MTKEEKVQSKYYVTTFYKFFDWPKSQNPEAHARELESWCREHTIKGLVIVSSEGFNGTLSSPQPMTKLKDHLTSLSGSKIVFKDSFTNAANPFRRMKVKVREEIVTLGKTEITPKTENKPQGVKHLSPKQWHDFLISNPDVQLVDVRNGFEIELGTFKKAKNWGMQSFTEFPDLAKKSDFDKNKPVLMFCTGGIRCEKASLEMSEQGYGEVYQLDGGILNYLAEFPNQEFDGECFVFDHRVAVDQKLEPSTKHSLCIHCGQPAGLETFDCIQCKNESFGVCKICWEAEDKFKTCSKNCAHHFSLGHKATKPHSDSKRIKYAK
jgi:UPF0176 protein